MKNNTNISIDVYAPDCITGTVYQNTTFWRVRIIPETTSRKENSTNVYIGDI